MIRPPATYIRILQCIGCVAVIIYIYSIHLNVTELLVRIDEVARFKLSACEPVIQSARSIKPAESPAAISKPLATNESTKWLTTQLFAVAAGGGLGNQLFEIIALIGIADLLGRTPYITALDSTLIKNLENTVLYRFPTLLDQTPVKMIDFRLAKVVNFNANDCCRYDNVTLLQGFDPDKLLYLQGVYFQSFKYFDHMRSKVREWLLPSDYTLERAKKHLPPHFIEENQQIICIHIRRGDFTTDGVHQPSDLNFTKSATEYLVSKHRDARNVTVTVLGNDPLWAYDVFRDKIHTINGVPLPSTEESDYEVVITPTLDPTIDIAFSRDFCEVVLITAPSSTFGFWLSYLSKDNSTVYYRDIRQTNDGVLKEMDPEDFFPPDWHELQTMPNGQIIESKSG